MKPSVLVLIPLSASTLSALAEKYNVLNFPDVAGKPTLPKGDAASVVGIVSNGTTGCSPALLGQLPNLKIVSSFGAGYESIAVREATERGVQVTHAPGTNGATVADHALALSLAVARDICSRNDSVHAGNWAKSRSPRPTLNGSTVGIVGMGRIGRMVASRAAAFGATIAYFDPTTKDPSLGETFDDVAALAEKSDFLIATCPGGPATHHLINAQVLEALGPDSFFINVSRGTVADTASLVDALEEGRIAGAAIDVFEEEPEPPASLLAAPRLIITPHMAGRSPASLRAQTELLLMNLEAALSGRRCQNHVPMPA